MIEKYSEALTLSCHNTVIFETIKSIKDRIMTIKKTNRKTFFINLKTQYENAGDLLTNKCLIDELRKYGQPVINTSDMPDDFMGSLELKKNDSVNEYRFRYLLLKGMLKSLLKVEKIYFISGPGHDFGSSWNQALKLFKFGMLLKIIKFFGVNIIKAPCSIGPFSSRVALAEKYCLSAFDCVYLRDSISLSYCNKLGSACDYCPDLSYLNDINYKVMESYSGDYIVLSFREGSYSLNSKEDYEEMLFLKMDSMLAHLLSHSKYNIIISYQVSRDRGLCLKFKERYTRLGYEVVFHDESLDVKNAVSLYSNAKLIFSNRLHVLLLGLISGSVPLAVIDKNRHDKITGIFIDDELENCISDIYEIGKEAEFLKEKFDNFDQYIKKMATIKKKRSREIKDEFRRLFCD